MEIQIRPAVNLSENFDKLNIKEYTATKTQDILSLAANSIPSGTKSSYIIRVVRDDEKEAVLDHLRQFFFKDEPLNKAIRLIEREYSRTQLENFSTKCLEDGVSLVAVSLSGKIVGVGLNGMYNVDCVEEEEPCDDPKFSKIIKLLDYLEANVSEIIKKSYASSRKVMNIKIVSVDQAWRGKGIAKNLIKSAREMALKNNCDLMRTDCTSSFSARAVAHLGYDCVYRLKYEDFREDGKPIFVTEYPHVAAEVYLKKSSDDC